MKPDAHKRKKNAIYKKKHGIVTAPKSGDSQKGKPDLLQKDNTKQGANQSTTAATGQHGSDGVGIAAAADPKLIKLPLKKTSDDDDDDDDDDEAVDQSASFSRRKLMCNWERYEELPPEPGAEPEEPEPEVDLDYMRSFAAKALLELESKRDEFCMYNDTDVPCEQFLSIDAVKRGVKESASSTAQERLELQRDLVSKPKVEAVVGESDNLRSIAISDIIIKSNVTTQSNANQLNDNTHLDQLVVNDPQKCVVDPRAEDPVLNELLSSTNLDRKQSSTTSDSNRECTDKSTITLSDDASDHKENCTPNSGVKDTNIVIKSVGSTGLSSQAEKPATKADSVVMSNSSPNNESRLSSMKMPLSQSNGFSPNTCRNVPVSILKEVKLPAVQNVPSLSQLEDDLDLLLAM